MKLWDVATRREVVALKGSGHYRRGYPHKAWDAALAFSPDGKMLALASDQVRLWDVAGKREVAALKAHFAASAVTFSPDGRTLATGGHHHNVKLWDVATRRNLATLSGVTGWVLSLAFSPDGRTLTSGYQDPAVRL